MALAAGTGAAAGWLVLLELVLVLLWLMSNASVLCARLNRQRYWSIGRRARLCTAGSWYRSSRA